MKTQYEISVLFERAIPLALLLGAVAVVIISPANLNYAVMGAIAIVYALLAILKWEVAARAALVGVLVVPIGSVIPGLGSRFVIYASLVAIYVAAVGLTKDRRVTGIPILLFLLWQMASVMRTYLGAGHSLGYPLLLVPAAMLAVYFIVQARPKEFGPFLLAGVVVVCAIEAVIGVSQSILGVPNFPEIGSPVFVEARNYFGYLIPGLSRVSRLATGTFEHFNGLGALLCMGTVIAYWYWTSRRSVARTALLALLVAGLVLTFSRGSLIGTLVGVTVVYVLQAGRGRRFTRWVFVTCVVGVTLAALWDVIVQYASTTNTLGSREDVWAIALSGYGRDLVQVFFGSGFAYYQVILREVGSATQRLHSAPLQLLLETGLVGVALFVWAVVYAFRPRKGDWIGLSVPAAGAVVAFFVASIFDNSLAGILGATWFGLLAILAAAREGIPDAVAEGSPVSEEPLPTIGGADEA